MINKRKKLESQRIDFKSKKFENSAILCHWTNIYLIHIAVFYDNLHKFAIKKKSVPGNYSNDKKL